MDWLFFWTLVWQILIVVGIGLVVGTVVRIWFIIIFGTNRQDSNSYGIYFGASSDD